MKLTSILVGVALLLVPGQSQADDLARFYPANSYIYMGSSGWNGIEDSFQRSPAGKVWSLPRFAGLREHLCELPSIILSDMARNQIEVAIDVENPLPIPAMAALDPQMLRKLGKFAKLGVALGFPGADIDPMDPDIQGYLIIDAGDEVDEMRKTFSRLLMGQLLEDPAIEKVGDIQWAMGALALEPAVELWWGVHQQRLVVALGESSIRTYLDVCQGTTSSLAASQQYQRGMQRCIGSSRINASFHLDFPAILDQIVGIIDEFGAMMPPEAEALLDEISRIGTIHVAAGEIGEEEVAFTVGTSIPFAEMVGGGPPLTSQMFDILPVDSLLVASVSFDLGATYNQLTRSIESLFPEEEVWKVEQGKKTLQAVLGTSIDDLLAAAGHRITFFEESTSRGVLPGIVCSVAGANADLFGNIVRKQLPVIQMLSGNRRGQWQLRTLEIPDDGEGAGKVIHYLDTGSVTGPVTLSWTSIDDELLLALHPTVLEQTIARLDTRTDETPRFEIPGFPIDSTQDQCNGMLSLDVGGALEWIWPSVVPVLQLKISEGIPGLDAGAIPPAHLFQSWKIHGRSTVDGSGYREALVSPAPIGVEMLGGALLGLLAYLDEAQQAPLVEIDDAAPEEAVAVETATDEEMPPAEVEPDEPMEEPQPIQQEPIRSEPL